MSYFTWLFTPRRVPAPVLLGLGMLSLFVTILGVFFVPRIVLAFTLIAVALACANALCMSFKHHEDRYRVDLTSMSDTTPSGHAHTWALVVLAGSLVPPMVLLVGWTAWSLVVIAATAAIIAALGFLWRHRW